MENIYKPPESDIEINRSPDKHNFKLFKVSAVGLATFFGTMLAGGLILSMNFKRLGKESEANKALWYSLLATFIMFAVVFMIPEDINIPNVVFTVIQLAVMIQIAKSQQETDIDSHMNNGGALEFNWKAFGLSLLVLLGVIFIMMAVMMVFVI